MPRTRLSSKGQLVIPKDVRDRHGWVAGTEIEIADKGHVVELRPVKRLFPPTTFEQVRGCLKYDGPPVSIEDMHAGIGEAAIEMWDEFERQLKK
jgi:AbrB family looped-hinge helix DNA binding protein